MNIKSLYYLPVGQCISFIFLGSEECENCCDQASVHCEQCGHSYCVKCSNVRHKKRKDHTIQELFGKTLIEGKYLLVHAQSKVTSTNLHTIDSVIIMSDKIMIVGTAAMKFGISTLHPWQVNAITAALDGKDI